jgi:hypothetical protein
MKKKKVKRKKLPPLSRLRNQADRLWSRMILADGTGSCQVCHKRFSVSAHHVFHKGAHARARYDRRNGLPICTGCHLRERFDPAPVVCRAIEYHRTKFFDLERDIRQFNGKHVWNRERLNMVIIAMNTILEGSPGAVDPVAV